MTEKDVRSLSHLWAQFEPFQSWVHLCPRFGQNVKTVVHYPRTSNEPLEQE